jgi:hypothetical protein
MCFLKACFFQIKPGGLLFRAYLSIMQGLYNLRICYFGECGGTFQVLFLNRRGHKINFMCHLCLLGIKDHASSLLTRMKNLFLLESLFALLG